MKTAAKDFKMTELGPIPKDWEVKRLGDVGEPLMCKRVLKSQTSDSGDVPFYKIGTFGGEADSFISQELFDSFRRQYSYPKKGDVLISAAGTIGRSVVFDGKDAYFQDSNIVWIGNDETIVSNEYLRWCYGTVKWHTEDGGTVSRLYNNNLRETLILVPPLPEQRKIAAALSDVDEMIAALEKLIEKKRKIKTGAMQRLLTGKTRLPGFKGAWVEKRLGEAFEFHSNNTFSRASMIEGRGQIYNIHYGDVLISYGAVLDCNKTAIPSLDDAASSVCKRDFLKDGDVIIADTAEDETVGKAVEVVNVGDRLIASGLHTIFLRPKEGTFALGWLGYYVNSTAFHDQLLPLITGIKVSSISKGSLMDTVLRCPPTLAEQKAIAKVLGDMDEEIAALEAELAKTRQLKQGMMQELLTGRVRLV